MHPTTAAVILARGGSKGIPLKNITPLCGLPLMEWNIRAVLDFGKFDSVWVSTDNHKIAEFASSLGTNVHWRSKEVSTDETPSIISVQEFLSHNNGIDIAALVQCTTPFLHPSFLESAFDMVFNQKFDSVFTVTRKKQLRWKEVEKCESTSALNFDPQNRPRRQDWKGELIENGVFYMAKRPILQSGFFQGGKCGYVEMPNECSFEIDSEWHCAAAENLIPQFGYHTFQCKCTHCSNK